ncbi:MAG: type II secretion system protein [Limisphaerales bacterium]
MKLSFRPLNNRAFTAIELAVVVAGLSLPAMLLPALGKAKAKANRIKCTNNLRSVMVGHLSFAQDNRERMPWQLTPTQLKNHWFADRSQTLNIERIWTSAAMKRELQTPKILVSPCDPQAAVSNERIQENWRSYSPQGPKLPRQGLSYALHLGADILRPETILALTRNIDGDDALPYDVESYDGEDKNIKVPLGRSLRAGSPNAAFIGVDQSSNSRVMAGLLQSQGQLALMDGSATQTTDIHLQRQLRNHKAMKGGVRRGESYEHITRPRQ